MTGETTRLRRASSAIALGLLASIVAVIVAPQASMAGFSVTAGWAPQGVVLCAGVLAYETGLWASGLAALLSAWRLGYRRDRSPIFVVFASILSAEAAFALVTGTPLAAYTWLTGSIARLLIAAATLALAFRLAQPRR